METETVLKQIANDVADIKKRIVNIEVSMEELDLEKHNVKPEYANKLKEIEKGKFFSESEFEKELGL